MIIQSSIPFEVKLCLFYNKLFEFRAKTDPLIAELARSERSRKENPRDEDLRYAEMEYLKAKTFLDKFGKFSLSGRRVLDFGCRFGGSSVWYAEQGAADVVGIDVSQEMIDTASEFLRRRQFENSGRPLVGKVEFRRGATRRIPVEDDSIDLILCEDVVEHLQEPDAIFREWWRVLVPGGKIICSFGPLWYHPHGIHLWEIFPAPWTHLLFSEQTVCLARNILKADGGRAVRYTDVNKMTLRRFEKLVSDTELTLRSLVVHGVWKLNALLRLPVIRELFASEVVCILEKRPSGATQH